MNIAFDIDDTLVNNDMVTKYLAAQGYDPYKVLRNFHIRNLKITKAEAKYIHTMFSMDEMNHLKPNPNAQYVIETLSQSDINEIFLITARGEEVKDGTINMINDHFPTILEENIFFTAGGSKEDILKELEIDVFVEDNIEAVLELAPKMPEVKFFVLSYSETPHNHDPIAAMDPLPNVTVVENLIDILS